MNDIQLPGGQLEVADDVFFFERRVADDVDLADLGAIAFFDLDRHADAVVLELLDRRRHLRRVFAAAVILFGQRVGQLIERRAIERLARASARSRSAPSRDLRP